MAKKSKRGTRHIEAPMEVFELPKTKRKSWSLHDLKSIRALTENQAVAIDFYHKNLNLGLFGCAGTGKTLMAVNLALQSILHPDCPQDKLVIIRSAVQSRDQGFMPGNLEEKMKEYETPLHGVFEFLLGRPSSYSDMKEAGLVEFTSTSFLRSLTIDNAIIVFDECQNALFRELDTVITRAGKNTKVIFVGDSGQDDLTGMKNQVSGLPQAIRVLKSMSSIFGVVEFTTDDIVRSELAKAWIKACHALAA